MSDTQAATDGAPFHLEALGPREDLLRQRWRFSRVGGQIFSTNLRLLPNGLIGNYSHPNEYCWRLTADGLEFCNRYNVVTTRFDRLSVGTAGGPKFTSKVLLEPSDQAGVHALEAVGPTWGRGRPLQTKPKVAVFIRTQLANEKLNHLIECLEGSPLFDLYILADEPRGALPLNPAVVPVLSHSVDMCRALGWR